MSLHANAPAMHPHDGEHVLLPDDAVRTASGRPAVLITRTSQGWAVVSGPGTEPVDDLVEALSLADLIVEELGQAPRPDDAGRRAVRGCPADAAEDDPVARELSTLRRTVSQLEHALSTRVTTERAIGVLAERQQNSPREAFEGLRRRARSTGRLVHDLAREVLDTLPDVRPPAAATPTVVPGLTALPLPATPSDDAAARTGGRRVTRSGRRGLTVPPGGETR